MNNTAKKVSAACALILLAAAAWGLLRVWDPERFIELLDLRIEA